MVPLVVDPEALFAAGSAVEAAGGGLAANLTVLTAGFSAHTGLDVAGMVFGLAYQEAAGSVLKAAAAAVNACRSCGATIQLGAANYSRAEAASRLGGGAGVLQPPAQPEKIAAPGAPGTWGPGQPPPPLWALVQSFLDDVWPDGDVAALRAAAERWRNFGAAASGMPGTLNASKSLLDAQHIPEGPKIDDALSQMGAFMARIGEASAKLATALDDFANEVDDAQSKIRDLLHRLGSLTDLAHDVMLILEGDAFDELEKIAGDIGGVQRNLARQAQAYEQAIKFLTQLGDGLVVKFEQFMRGQFVHFLGEDVGNSAATAFDTVVNVNEGFIKGGVGMVQGMAELDPRRFLIDPEGAASTWKGMFKGSFLDLLLHPEEGAEANLQSWKALLHLGDWSTTRPGLGFGENVVDIASLFVPGAGEAGVAAEGAGAAGRGAEAAADAAGMAERAGGRVAGEVGGLAGVRGALGDLAKSGGGLATDVEGVAGNLPKIEPPAGGRPVGLPPGKPPEAPAESAPRPGFGPNDGVPSSTGAPSDPFATPTGGPHEPAPVAPPHAPVSAPAAPVDPMPLRGPYLVEPLPAQVPFAPSGSPVEPAPTAAHSPQPTPETAASGVQAPRFTPSARPGEVSPPGDGLSPGGQPRGMGHGGEPHGPGEDGRPHSRPHERGTHDWSPHEPGDGGDHQGATTDLTPKDLSALADYTGAGYRDLNDALRSNVLDASQHARIEALNNALDKLPAYQGPVIRGTNLPPEVLALYQPGEVITEDAFLSTTANVAVARSPSFVGNVEFLIMSTAGRDISSFSVFPAEQEILFRAGTSFYVVSKVLDPLTGKTIIRMVER